MVSVVRRDDDGDFEVWLEPEPGDQFVGLCCGSGRTQARAIEQALCELAVVVEKMRAELVRVATDPVMNRERD